MVEAHARFRELELRLTRLFARSAEVTAQIPSVLLDLLHLCLGRFELLAQRVALDPSHLFCFEPTGELPLRLLDLRAQGLPARRRGRDLLVAALDPGPGLALLLLRTGRSLSKSQALLVARAVGNPQLGDATLAAGQLAASARDLEPEGVDLALARLTLLAAILELKHESFELVPDGGLLRQ